MCGTCGCSEQETRVSGPEEHAHGSGDHTHAPGEHAHGQERVVSLEVDVLAKNDARAERTRQWLAEQRILAVNLMSSPGSGKTTLLERTLRELLPGTPAGVVEGDQETLLDATRLRDTGCRTVQINTGAGCHLDAEMLGEGLRSLQPVPDSVVFVENVGNLVCPALFDLGERHKVVVASVTEGEDKPLKYPYMFRSADLVLLNKIDLVPHLDFPVERFVEHAQRVNPDARVLPVSATRGDGIVEWCDWVRARIGESRRGTPVTAAEEPAPR